MARVRRVGEEVPGWGALPVEAYMIKSWNYDSTEPVAEQRLRLIQEFILLEEIPKEYYDKKDPNFRLATQDEVNNILRDWRSDDVRKLANHIWQRQNCFPYLLRAWYEPGNRVHDEKMREWLAAYDELNEEGDCNLIEGEDLFKFPQSDYPTYWRTIYAQLPEIAGPELMPEKSPLNTFRWKGIPPWYLNVEEQFKEDIAYNKKENPRLWKENSQYLIEACAARIQRACAYHPIILLDKAAFDTGNALLMYVDNHTNVIRQTRFPLNVWTLMAISEDWFEGSLTPWMWHKSQVGRRWKIDGDIGQSVYQLTPEDLEPPAGHGPSTGQPASAGQSSCPEQPTFTEEHCSVSLRPRSTTPPITDASVAFSSSGHSSSSGPMSTTG